MIDSIQLTRLMARFHDAAPGVEAHEAYTAIEAKIEEYVNRQMRRHINASDRLNGLLVKELAVEVARLDWVIGQLAGATTPEEREKYRVEIDWSLK